MCRGDFRRPSNDPSRVGEKVRFWHVMLRKITVLLDSIFVIWKNIDEALCREPSSSAKKIECNQGA